MPQPMRTEVANAKKARVIMAEGGCGIPLVRTSNKPTKMAARAQGSGARAHVARSDVTSPKSKAGMVGSQQV